MLSFGAIGFAAPWALLGLLALPGIWWLLRATPPSPKTLAFPAVRILRELKRTPESPARSPWWLTALRVFAAAALIFGLADPRFEPDPAPPGAGPVLLAIDNGWASGPHWPAMRDAAQRVIDRAERADRAVILLPTAPDVDASPPAMSPALPARQAADRLRALNPQPWPVDRAAAADALRAAPPEGSTAAYWIADGLDGDGSAELGAVLNAAGPLVIEEPARAAPRTALIRAGGDAEGLSFRLRRPADAQGDAGPAAAARLVATDAEGRGLAAVEAVFADGGAETTARLEAPRGLRNRIARVAIEGEASAAATALADDGWARRAAGVVVTGGAEEARPLLSETYYITRALEPETDVVRGDVSALIAAGVGLIILPDAASVSTADQLALLSFAREGGGILRFAGPRLADAAAAGESDADPLLPLRLRRSNRVLGGAMSWSEPAELAPFDADSPLAGLPTPREARVRQQLLAQPGADLNDRAWARLEDGTPLVTARAEGEGFLALAHVTADPRWSDLPLTAGYVGMLRRLAALGGGRASAPVGGDAFAPDAMLDGFGRAVPPGPAARAFGIEPPAIGPRRPPGLYTSGGARLAVDLGPAVSAELAFLPRIPGADRRQGFAGESGARLGGALLAAALIALLIDALASLHLRGLLMRGGAVAALALAVMATPPPAQANTEEELIAAATRTRLAWLATSDARSDEIAQAGLSGLTTILGRRTAVEAAEPRAVDAATDPLALFPLIYWRLTPAQTGLSAQETEALNAYLANGGQLLIDLADGATSDTLLRLSGGLDAPPLAPVPPDHVLTRAFYLLQDFPGRRPGGQVWVDRDGAANRDGVSSMIVASADFSGAWAVGPTGQPAFPVSPGGERQRELAYRFGVNVVLYALTGNYKADQVHVPAILDRLGQ